MSQSKMYMQSQSKMYMHTFSHFCIQQWQNKLKQSNDIKNRFRMAQHFNRLMRNGDCSAIESKMLEETCFLSNYRLTLQYRLEISLHVCKGTHGTCLISAKWL